MGAWAGAMDVRWESAEFAPDGEFPELLPWIIDGYDLRFGSLDKTYKDIVSLGATLRLFFRNEGSQPVQIDGILLDGINLAEHILPKHKPHSFEDLEDSSFDLVISLSPEAHHRALELTRTMAIEAEYWPTMDPSITAGSREQILDSYREVRDQLVRRIKQRFGSFAARGV